ncbi:hypothetical protein V6N13_148640 [Hibiscus sabdariffa]|uniref:Uncharacterized protein n=1 Tax=Hibiscus sabdariffa TaxID=183260 RepID=A0ABR2TZ50_9ROSI
MVGPSSPSQGKDQNSQQIHTHNLAPRTQGHAVAQPRGKADPHSVPLAKGRTRARQHPPIAGWKRGGTSHKNIATRATQYGDKPPQRGKPILHPGHRQRPKVTRERARGSCLKTLVRNATREPAMETKARNPPYQLATTQPASSTRRTDQGLPSSHSRTAHTTRPRSM